MPELPVSEAIKKRRSIKAFKPDPIDDKILSSIMESTINAPSSWNFQPTRVIMLKSREQKEKLAAVAWHQKQITQAPVVFVYAASIRGWEQKMDKVISTAQEKGAWPDKFAGFIRESAPGFQAALGDKEREYAIKDAMISATHTALAAEAYGLGTCFMNGWDEKGVKEIIGAGDDPDIAIALVLPCGYPLETPADPGRLPQNEVIFTDFLE
ncbi:MAG: nitroreductase family protein [Verrucomicrobiota bacterium]